MSARAFVGLCLVGGIGIVSACAQDPEPMDEGGASVEALHGAELVGDERSAAAVVNASLPDWEAGFSKAAKAAASPVGALPSFQTQSGKALGMMLASRGDFQFVETKVNGRELFRSKTGRSVVKVLPSRGYLKFFLNETLPVPSEVTSKLSESRTADAAARQYAALGLPEEEKGEVESYPIMALAYDAGDAPGELEVAARVVEYHRQVGGVEVLRSRMRAYYGLDGTLFLLNVQWPQFKLDPEARMATRDKVVQDLARHIAERTPKQHAIRDCDSRLAYRFNPDTLSYEPAVITQVVWERTEGEDDVTPFNLQVEYSLHRGIVEKESGR